MRYNISPSKLARYFYHDCERQLLAMASGGVTKEEGPEKETSLVVELLQDTGYDWEERVVEEHLKNARVHIAPGEGELSGRFFTQAQFLELIPRLHNGDWVYQPTLKVGPKFHERFGLDPELIRFPACRPDLLRYRDQKFEIVDVKASDALKASHRVQVASRGTPGGDSGGTGKSGGARRRRATPTATPAARTITPTRPVKKTESNGSGRSSTWRPPALEMSWRCAATAIDLPQ